MCRHIHNEYIHIHMNMYHTQKNMIFTYTCTYKQAYVYLQLLIDICCRSPFDQLLGIT